MVTVPPEKKEEFEKIMENNVFSQIGVVSDDCKLKVRGLDGDYVINSDLNYLKLVWKKTLGDL